MHGKRTFQHTILGLFALLAPAACGPASPEPVVEPPIAPTATTPKVTLPAEPTPLGRLPTDTRPTRYRIDLKLDPSRPRFEGVTDITVDLDRPRDVIWLHGKDLEVTRVTVQPEGVPPMPARWEQKSKSGVVALRTDAAVGPGRITVHVEYSAAYGKGDEGLVVKERSGSSYVFSQLEATYARRVFPSFDEPSFKTPFEVVMHVPKGSTAIGNTHEIARSAESIADPAAPQKAPQAWERISFAPTEKLPTYLVALMSGPLDVVDGPVIPPNAVRSRPLPLRGVATRGKGKDMAYALSRTGALVAALESYFGIEYPYDKLDMIAVPDKGGAMENAGAITFAEGLLLLDEKNSPVDQKRLFSIVAAHELSHQWFGNLVTMQWWDDLWLNESFATWAETRIVATVSPELAAEVEALRDIHRAMGGDSLVSARKIRQEIESDDDIGNAFDGITYQKGAGVIGMFERWMGAETFQKGIRAHLTAHRHGGASAADLLNALGAAAGRDVATPFRTFLDQPGLPFVEASLSCEGKPSLSLKQSRFLPLGSTGDEKKAWQLPVCARYPDGKALKTSCTLLTEHEGKVPLDTATCPAWVMPNADAGGYYRWSLGPNDTKKLAAAGLSALTVRERMSFVESINAGFVRAKLPASEALAALAPLANDGTAAVAAAPMRFLAGVRDWLHAHGQSQAVEAYAQKLYAPAFKSLGWAPAKGAEEAPERAVLRQEVIYFLAVVAKDPAVRREALSRGRAWAEGKRDAVSLDLAAAALTVAMQEDDGKLFDKLVKRLEEEQGQRERSIILHALGSAGRPELAERARALTVDPKIRLAPREVTVPLRAQMERAETRDVAWAWMQQNVDGIIGRISERWGARLPWIAVGFCDKRHAEEVNGLFQPRLASLNGLPRELAGALEDMRLCAARREAQESSVRAFFAKKKGR
ncbi:Membrane alanine aminopeptidase N [Minicystis rosea]|nr:Membrane alanine aminopeptidase N [Minicystis rosea]